MSNRTNRIGRRKRKKEDFYADREHRRQFFQHYLYFLEGLADYSKAKHSYGDNPDDHRKLGWTIGRQIAPLYLLEMLLRIDHELRGDAKSTNHHNLARLFRRLPNDRKSAAEKTYKRLLNSEVEWTWDVFCTIESSLRHLGENPITRTRYPWSHHEDTHYWTDELRRLVDALFIGLHNYPVKVGALDKRFDTEFRSLEESKRSSPGGEGTRPRKRRR